MNVGTKIFQKINKKSGFVKINKNTKKCEFSDSAAAKRRQIGASSYFDRHQEEYQSYIFHSPLGAIFKKIQTKPRNTSKNSKASTEKAEKKKTFVLRRLFQVLRGNEDFLNFSVISLY
jgi:hypothetical protein